MITKFRFWDEGNSFHPINCTPTLAHVDDPEMHYIDLINYFNGDEDDIDNARLEDVNAIIIN